MNFSFQFLGVRGSIACPTPNHMEYGGNTSCIYVQAGDQHIILDAGTGIRDLSAHFLSNAIQKASLLLTHTHWDHINGFPFFTPLYQEGRAFDIYAGHLTQMGGIQATLSGQMSEPMFPVPLQGMRANNSFLDFKAGETFKLGNVVIKTTPLNHPNGATGYRIEQAGKALCYITDTEHTIGKPDQNILNLIAGADHVIYDCTYTDEEYPKFKGWGHSTWEEGVRLCKEAKAKHLHIFHHDPAHTDDVMKTIGQKAAEVFPATVAKEKTKINL